MDTVVKPCPFCQSINVRPSPENAFDISIICADCGGIGRKININQVRERDVSIPKSYDRSLARQIEMAIEAWNIRVN